MISQLIVSNVVSIDYSEGTNVKFQTRFPAELQDKIEREQFEYTVKMMNTMYQEAGKANCATFCEGAMACMTAYLIHFCSETVSLIGPTSVTSQL